MATNNYGNPRKKKEQVWNKGQKIRGKDPDLYRRDPAGNVMYKYSYGKATPMGWEIDHSRPRKEGGTNHLNNLRPLNTSLNRGRNNKK
ncbi:MAG: HNH endonuclease [bacterium]|nr:HNH endonuclease [bacterium]